jgi:hypothetical protein
LQPKPLDNQHHNLNNIKLNEKAKTYDTLVVHRPNSKRAENKDQGIVEKRGVPGIILPEGDRRYFSAWEINLGAASLTQILHLPFLFLLQQRW